MRLTPILAAGLIAAAATAEAGTFPSGGVGTGTSKDVVHQIAEGHMVMDVLIEYSGYEMETADHPMSGMSGPCVGSVEIRSLMADGSGKCVFTDADGETALIDWTATGLAEDGAFLGRWEPAGGTGKWTDATGGGDFMSKTDTATGIVINRIDGEITMP